MFEDIENKTQKQIYDELWADQKLPGDVVHTWYKHGEKSKDSPNSYQFDIPKNKRKNFSKRDKKEMCIGLKELFKIDDENFEKHFEEACFGEGNEYKEIMRLHSSSLCALLFFSEISEKKPLTLKINNKDISFTKVLFEYKNKVINNPSSVDVVLVSDDEKVLLFLESKFSEYLNTSNKYTDLSPQYLDEYAEIYNYSLLNSVGLQIIKENNKPKIFERTKKGKKVSYNGFMTIDKKEKTYLEGIKQMISHYIGLKHFVTEPRMEKGIKYNNQKVILGEIMFDFSFEEAQTKFNNYSKMYSKLANKLNTMDKRIYVLEEPLKYSMFKTNGYKLNPIVREFYFGNSK